ncbi:tRNA (N6-isopentenyl adenosine(37)-C2)-methylthiotransferase MiaB, partial [Microbispora rosea]
DNRLVHVAAADARPGDMVTVEVTYAAPHHLVADKVLSVRRTRAGDAWEARQAAPQRGSSVNLGMPAIGRPAPLPAEPSACSAV